MGGRCDVEFHVNHYTPEAAARAGKNLEMFTHSVWLSLNDFDRDISLEEIQIIDDFYESLNLVGRSNIAYDDLIF